MIKELREVQMSRCGTYLRIGKSYFRYKDDGFIKLMEKENE